MEGKTDADPAGVASSDAPGWPGLAPRWTSSDKTGVGTAMSPLSRVWFTISHGILNEVYFPRVDKACTRDFGLIVTDGTTDFFAEEKRDTTSAIAMVADGVPAYRVTNTSRAGKFVIEKQIIADPQHDVILQLVTVRDAAPGLRFFALLAPHLVNGGAHNTAWVGDYKGVPMLFAEGDGTTLALACSNGWVARSAGFVATSDGWTLLHRDGHLADQYQRAADGNVALTGEFALWQDSTVVLALGFGNTANEAGMRARAALLRPFAAALDEYAAVWRAWQGTLQPLRGLATAQDTYRISTAVLRTHEAPGFAGGIIASLSIPWGFNKGDDDLGGYHLIWPRDLVETAGGLLAAGATQEARRVLDYLRAIQEPDGSWPQNCWLDGTPYWRGVQMDECAFPMLLVDMCRRHGALTTDDVPHYWRMTKAALGFVLSHGPVTGQDRWEEDAGYSPFTLAVQIAALLAAADIADVAGASATGTLCRETADAWNESIEDWCYAVGAPVSAAAGAAGHYVRIAPPIDGTAAADVHGLVQIRNLPPDEGAQPADAIMSPDALALVRFGLRAADDPRMLATVATIDHWLRKEFPVGPSWYRYRFDGYGEKADGSAFDGSGIGRPWPLLTAERAHYALAAGRPEEARALLAALEGFASSGFLIPEQVWDGEAVMEHELVPGKATGSAMPLVWAHAEHIKLCRSLADGAVFDMPPQTVARYIAKATPARVQPWRPDWRATTLRVGRVLRLDLPAPATIAWSADAWATKADVATTDTGLGLHVAEVPSAALPAGAVVRFRLDQAEHAVTVV